MDRVQYLVHSIQHIPGIRYLVPGTATHVLRRLFSNAGIEIPRVHGPTIETVGGTCYSPEGQHDPGHMHT